MLLLKGMVEETFWMKKVKDIAIDTRGTGDVIKRKQVLNIVKGFVKPNNLNSLEGFSGTLEITNKWARDLLKKLQ